MIHYSPENYDSKGQLKLPFLFWLILILQARTWIVLVIAGASRQQGETLLSLFYPDRQGFYPGLALGLIAVAAFLLSGYRQRMMRLWSAWRWVLVAGSLITFGWQLTQLNYVLLEQSPLPVILLIFDLLSAYWLLANHRLRDCFIPDSSAVE
ncbi:membrane protein [Tatumella morbirosei]|uniref:Membrane protein n=1 Tax=Tatumella morbirosei TaxID=642227 RepID=A0A095UDC7_9GAMM|nr:DUF2919 domain-containing protein [Tatumella morbirosei]KGD72438.1 membrane protein [Tatumella morbirosei]